MPAMDTNSLDYFVPASAAASSVAPEDGLPWVWMEKTLVQNAPEVANRILVRAVHIMEAIRLRLTGMGYGYYKWVLLNASDLNDITTGRRIASVVEDPQLLTYVRDLAADIYMRMDGVKIQQDDNVPKGTIRYVTSQKLPTQPNWFLDMIRAGHYSVADQYLDGGVLKYTLYYDSIQNPPLELMLPAGYEYKTSGIDHTTDHLWKITVWIDERHIRDIADAAMHVNIFVP